MLPDKPFVPLARFHDDLLSKEPGADGKPLARPFRTLDYLEENHHKSQYYTAPMYMSGNLAMRGLPPIDRRGVFLVRVMSVFDLH